MILSHIYDVDISQPLLPTVLQPMMVTGDKLANRIGVRLRSGAQPYTPDGSCRGYVLRADGATVPILNGVANGNEMYIDLPEAAYAVQGSVVISIVCVTSTAITTVFLGSGTVNRSQTDVVIDPGTVIDDISTLIQEIETAVASIPEDYSTLSSMVDDLQLAIDSELRPNDMAIRAAAAPNYGTWIFPVSAGDYVWYNGVLRKAKQDIATAEDWTAAHWDTAVIGEDIADLKSALGDFGIPVGDLAEKTYINTNTGEAGTTTAAGNVATGFLPVQSGVSIIISGAYCYGSRGVCFYRADQSYISSAPADHNNNGLQNITTTTPDEAAYIRATGYTGYDLSIRMNDNVLDMIGALSENIASIDISKLDQHLGAENAGKVLMVDASGDISPENVPLDLAVNVSPVVLKKDDLTLHGYLNTSTGAYTDAPTSETQLTTDFVELEPFALYKIEASSIYDGQTVTGFRAVILYNADKSFSRRLTNSDYPQFYLQNNEKYIRVNTNADEVYYLRLYKLATGYNDKRVLDGTIVVPQIAKVDTIPYIHARRPQIGFIIDGEYDKNEDMHDVFAAHGVTCGYAVPWNTDFPNNPLTKYVQWQNEGFEMITHGNYAIPEDYSGSDATAIGYINDSIKRMRANGLYPKGFIGSSGSVAERFIPYIKRLYDWAATVANHSTTAESCILFGVDKPYDLWRYSMQLSTLDQQKAAVDRCLSQNGLLLFYGHAKSDNADYFTEANLDALLTYIESVGAEVVNPSIGIEQYFAVRYDDIYSLIQ